MIKKNVTTGVIKRIVFSNSTSVINQNREETLEESKAMGFFSLDFLRYDLRR